MVRCELLLCSWLGSTNSILDSTGQSFLNRGRKSTKKDGNDQYGILIQKLFVIQH